MLIAEVDTALSITGSYHLELYMVYVKKSSGRAHIFKLEQFNNDCQNANSCIARYHLIPKTDMVVTETGSSYTSDCISYSGRTVMVL